MQWAAQTINAGQTTPWVTTEPPGDLASVSIYHAITRSDGTIKRRVYLGCKVDGWDLDVSEDSTIATLSLDISGSTPQGNQFDSSTDPTAGTFPAPTDSPQPVADVALRVYQRLGRADDRHVADAVPVNPAIVHATRSRGGSGRIGS